MEHVLKKIVLCSLERAEKLSAEVSVLSRHEGRFRRLYLWYGTKSELVDSCDSM